LRFDNNAEEAIACHAAAFGISESPDSKTYYTEAGAKASGRPKGNVVTVPFRLEGQEFMAMDSNLNHEFTFNEAYPL
jgi:predicted 3-demethylubiquinone-9 3-methyltransferase (glyoxalase superfamily)